MPLTASLFLLTRLVSALSALVDASKLLDLIFDVDFRGTLVLTELVNKIPTFRKEIQRRLLVRSPFCVFVVTF